MLVREIRVVDENDCCELKARIDFQTDWVWDGEPFFVWYRFPRSCRPYLDDQNGDPFLAALLAPAMVLGEDLQIEAPVSPRLMRSAHNIQEIYRCWNSNLHEVKVSAPIRRSDQPSCNHDRIGLFFSLGVDSSYSLLKNVERAPEAECITHLINITGFDVDLFEDRLRGLLQTKLLHVARVFGKDCLPVATNLRDFSDRVADWPNLYHGAALASVALCLRNFLRRVIIAASTTYDRLYPLGSHPLLDPLWSTEYLEFVHDGCEAERLMEKIRFVSRSPVLLNALRVCISDETTGTYNCGRCRKCLHAMVALHILGVLHQCEAFPEKIDLTALRNVPVRRPAGIRATKRLITELGTSAEDEAIRAALDECLRKNETVPNASRGQTKNQTEP